MLDARFAHIFFSEQNKKQKKESRLSGGVAALSRFLEKILPGLIVPRGN
tara:strand:- start:77228 stop:77374 length:147 start_codon:yes stop_codon:yes gene_type:complete